MFKKSLSHAGLAFLLIRDNNSGYLQTGTLVNSEDSDEMPHNAAFHQGLNCLLKIKIILRDRNILKFRNFDL